MNFHLQFEALDDPHQAQQPDNNWPIEDIHIGDRHRHDPGDVSALVRSIADIGLLHAIVITPAGELISGQRRLAACRELGWRRVPVEIFDIGPDAGVTKRNLRRRRRVTNIVANQACEPAVLRCELTVESALDLGQRLEPGSVDWVITDPPYDSYYFGEDGLSYPYDDLATMSAHILKPGGVLACVVAGYDLLWVTDSLRKHLDYFDILSMPDPWAPNCWFPVLLFSRANFVARGYLVESRAGDEVRDPEEQCMLDLMRRFVCPGDLVVDPYLGSGTTAVAAARLGTHFIGCDSDLDAVARAKKRLGSA